MVDSDADDRPGRMQKEWVGQTTTACAVRIDVKGYLVIDIAAVDSLSCLDYRYLYRPLFVDHHQFRQAAIAKSFSSATTLSSYG